MSILGIFIGLAGLILIGLVSWLMMLSINQKKLDKERIAKGEARRKALEREKEDEHQERLQKAESGHVPTILFMAKEAERFNVKDALYWYEKAAELDSETGMYGVVRLCKKTVGDMVYEEKGRFWQKYIQGLEGNMAALCDTGQAYLTGRGTNVDIEKGMSLLEKAALSNYTPAQLQLGDWFMSKDNPSPKPEDSCFWFAKAAKLESEEGMIKLGLNYLKGIGIHQDHRKACYWLERCSEKGNAKAMYHAGKAWIDHGEHGNSVAYVWLFCSAKCGYDLAQNVRDEVGNKLGVEAVVLLQNFAKPLLKKINEGGVSKHLLIKAFNKLYKRDIPIPGSNENSEDMLAQEHGELFENLSVQNVPDPASENKSIPAEKEDKASFEQSGVQVNTDYTDKNMH
ncbi:tetratricopeptide repeat protein [Vibrio quintilis]|uniref:Sel1 repeat protein n=1 Tax=Vibrio quintilis TaxID=1117707 RepID=A0A1M7YPM1_9VIBR|nr:tetratricopeptide repeat protein [Vibrio quintilis]SHO54577.1 Sel1 repeat protein [Vibrio quintilis]